MEEDVVSSTVGLKRPHSVYTSSQGPTCLDLFIQSDWYPRTTLISCILVHPFYEEIWPDLNLVGYKGRVRGTKVVSQCMEQNIGYLEQIVYDYKPNSFWFLLSFRRWFLKCTIFFLARERIWLNDWFRSVVNSTGLKFDKTIISLSPDNDMNWSSDCFVKLTEPESF